MHLRLAIALAALLIVSAASSAWAGEGRVYSSAKEVEPLAVGSPIPAANIRTVEGAPVDLREQLRGRGALLIFYRGGW
jgi:hypothetical protein